MFAKTAMILGRNGIFAAISVLFISGCAINQSSDQTPLQSVSQNAPGTSLVSAPPPIVGNGNVMLTNLNMNNQGNQLTVKPRMTIQAVIQYNYNCPSCDRSLNNQILIGLARRSAQACIYNGGPSGSGSVQFTLKAPAKPGTYDVRFRGMQAMDCADALKTGWNADNSPSGQTTIGTIIVSRKAET